MYTVSMVHLIVRTPLEFARLLYHYARHVGLYATVHDTDSIYVNKLGAVKTTRYRYSTLWPTVFLYQQGLNCGKVAGGVEFFWLSESFQIAM